MTDTTEGENAKGC